MYTKDSYKNSSKPNCGLFDRDVARMYALGKAGDLGIRIWKRVDLLERVLTSVIL